MLGIIIFYDRKLKNTFRFSLSNLMSVQGKLAKLASLVSFALFSHLEFSLSDIFLMSDMIENAWNVYTSLFFSTKLSEIIILHYKTTKFSIKRGRNEHLREFSDKRGTKVMYKKAHKLKLGSIYIHRKIEDVIRGIFTFINMPQNFTDFRPKIGFKSY